MLSTDPKSVLITGAAQRIGRAVALAFAADGWIVAVHYSRSREGAAAVVAEITGRGGRAVAVRADLAQSDEVIGLVPAVVAALGVAPACLINNAALFEDDTVRTMTHASFMRHMSVNLEAPLLLAQALDQDLPAGVVGNVINIIDQRVWRLTPEFLSYTLAKSALWTATRTLAQALAPRVRVNGIGPGPVLKSIHQSDADFAAEAAATPLGRATTTEEIVAAIRFILASPAMTGQMIALDSGQHLEWRSSLPRPGEGDAT